MSYKRKTTNCIQRAIVLFYLHSPSEVLRYNVDKGGGGGGRERVLGGNCVSAYYRLKQFLKGQVYQHFDHSFFSCKRLIFLTG